MIKFHERFGVARIDRSTRHERHPVDILNPPAAVMILGHQTEREAVFFRQGTAVDLIGKENVFGHDFPDGIFLGFAAMGTWTSIS